MDLNKVMIIGRVTNNPETKVTAEGVTVTTFGVATNFVWKDANGQQQEKPEFHNIVAWRRLGEICGQYLSKGRRVYVEGRLQTRNWVDQNGNKRWRTEIIADNMIMLDKAPEKALSPTPSEAPIPSTDQGFPSQSSETIQPQENISPSKESEEEIEIERIPF